MKLSTFCWRVETRFVVRFWPQYHQLMITQTTNTITFSVYMLARHPLVLQRLREEIILKLGSSKRPTYDDMKDMKYLRAVINGKPDTTSEKQVEIFN